jgi:hypothetical protein
MLDCVCGRRLPLAGVALSMVCVWGLTVLREVTELGGERGRSLVPYRRDEAVSWATGWNA